MARFRKRPVVGEVVEAVQFIVPEVGTEPPEELLRMPTGWFMRQIGGYMLVVEGDWIITGSQGEKRVVPAAVFEVTYEPILEESNA